MEDPLYEIKKTAYIEALTQLRMHAPLIWTRNNFFLTVQSASLIFYINEFDEKNLLLLLFLLALSFVIANFWVVVMRQGQDIQRQWREIAIAMEKQFFSYSLNINSPLHYANKTLGEGKNSNVSITTVLINLARLFRFVWLILFVVELFRGTIK